MIFKKDISIKIQLNQLKFLRKLKKIYSQIFLMWLNSYYFKSQKEITSTRYWMI